MRALTICQPYCHMIVTPVKPKTIENRTWYTPYRGPLVLHAGKNRNWLEPGDEERYPDMAWGALCGVASITACFHVVRDQMGQLVPTAAGPQGDRYRDLLPNPHAEGPYCWQLATVLRFLEPIPYTGRQGLYNVPDKLVRTAIGRSLRVPDGPKFPSPMTRLYWQAFLTDTTEGA